MTRDVKVDENVGIFGEKVLILRPRVPQDCTNREGKWIDITAILK